MLQDFLKTFSLTEFSGKTYFYTIHPCVLVGHDQRDGEVGAHVARRHGVLAAALSHLEGVQQSHFGSGFSFRHFKWQIGMEIGAQMRRAVILHLRPILKTSKLKIKMQIEVKWYIFLSVQQLRQTATLKRKLRREGTVEHFPGRSGPGAPRPPFWRR